MNSYFGVAIELQSKLEEIINNIFEVTNNEISINVEDVNILQRDNNSINSSTAIGYILEEYLIRKIEQYFSLPDCNLKILMKQNNKANTSSYDFSLIYKEHLFYINLKANRNVNDAIAAINRLYTDYVEYDGESPLHYLVFKTNYDIGKSTINSQNKIIVKSTYSYFLEQIDFSRGWKQDHRSWSPGGKLNSGRLMVSKNFFNENQIEISKMSYEKTRNYLEEMFNKNFAVAEYEE
ncbi:hypothetical protein NQV05_00965 [Mycoplasmopsis agalactiae]|uniref:UpaP162 family type II restriction enzyme n=1 Tax=Mycoplasmopsis agalactiae TaxID=2110 RepID=UPI00211BA74C|nr:hypothetical protein [Mycoplasmopsis agalactiae]UUM25712.1 hypothetical protein NQV05_00965 [Mycoplasmopsis agalactiae]